VTPEPLASRTAYCVRGQYCRLAPQPAVLRQTGAASPAMLRSVSVSRMKYSATAVSGGSIRHASTGARRSRSSPEWTSSDECSRGFVGSQFPSSSPRALYATFVPSSWRARRRRSRQVRSAAADRACRAPDTSHPLFRGGTRDHRCESHKEDASRPLITCSNRSGKADSSRASASIESGETKLRATA
jgi:hypothetical protein